MLKLYLVVENFNLKEFKKFEKNYLQEKCEKDVCRLKVLVGRQNYVGCRTAGEKFSSSIITGIAFVDRNGVLVQEKISFKYYLKVKKDYQYIETDELGVYEVKCKKIKEQKNALKNYYYLLKIKKSKDERFVQIIEEQLTPITLNIDEIKFNLDRRFHCYEGEMLVQGAKIKITLDTDDGKTDATTAINTFRKMQVDKGFCENVLQKVASEIADLANDWREDGTEYFYTAEQIQKRLKNNCVSISVMGNTYFVDWDDDGLFCGHGIQYCGNVANDEFRVDIVG